MGSIENLRIGSKLMLACALLTCGFGAMLYHTLESVALLQQSEALVIKRSYALVSDVKELRVNIQTQRIALLLAINQEVDLAKQADLEAEVQRLSLANAQLLARLREGLGDDREGREILEHLQEVRNAYGKTLDNEVIPALRSGRIEQTRELVHGVQVELADTIHTLGQQLAELTERRVQEILAHTQAALGAQRERIVVLGLLLASLSALLAWLLSRHITKPLLRLTGWAEQISRGDIPKDMSSGVRQDEVGRLGLAFTEMGRYLQALAGKAESLAQGQLPQSAPVSERDVLGQAFARMGQYVQTLAGKAEALARGELPEGFAPLSEHDVLGQAFARTSQYFQTLARKVEALARGELHEAQQPAGDRDVLGQAFAAMIGNLRSLIQELHEGIAVLASAAEEILAATTQVAVSTQETATAIGEITSTVEEVKQTAVLAGSKSQGVAESTERTRQVAQGGRQAVEEALAGMQQIREQMQAVAESIMRLGEQSQAIGEIVASVGDLAEQSNLLGVNASIEAVKAGEAGKGFSVVAQEVKALAEQSKQATAQVRGILGEIQKAMTKAVLLAEQGSKTVETGYQRAQSSGEAIRSLGSSIEASSEMALQIAATSQQQLVGMDQVASAMESIRQASQDNVGGTQQVDLAARNLHQLGLKLKGLAAQFKL